MGDETPLMVHNPYRAAIARARKDSTTPLEEISTALDAARSAMDGGCWVSTTADTFFAELATQRTTLSKVETDALAEFDDAIQGQPETVESTAWQTRWQKMI